MIAALAILLVVAVLGIVAFAMVAALLGLAVGGVVVLGVLAMKVLPLLLIGFVAVKVLGGGGSCGRARLRRAAPPSPDDAWLDSRA
jgi:hypothetical protein